MEKAQMYFIEDDIIDFGSFSTVQRATDTNGNKLAVKIIDRQKISSDFIRNELECLKKK